MTLARISTTAKAIRKLIAPRPSCFHVSLVSICMARSAALYGKPRQQFYGGNLELGALRIAAEKSRSRSQPEVLSANACLRQLSAGQQLSSEQEASQRPNQCANADYEKVCSHQYDSRPSPHPLRTDSWSQVE